MIYLLDINVLLGLAWPGHPDHAVARNWVARKEKSGALEIATCALVELGFLRISMQRFGADFFSAAELLDIITRRPQFKHHFWPETFSPAQRIRESGVTVQGHNQLNDFFLAELASAKKSKLATGDNRILHPAVENIRSEK